MKRINLLAVLPLVVALTACGGGGAATGGGGSFAAGTYSGSVTEGTGHAAAISLAVAGNGTITGSTTLFDTSTASTVSTATLTGTAQSDGTFSATGTYGRAGGGAVTVTGTIPSTGTVSGTISVNDNGNNYIGHVSLPPKCSATVSAASGVNCQVGSFVMDAYYTQQNQDHTSYFEWGGDGGERTPIQAGQRCIVFHITDPNLIVAGHTYNLVWPGSAPFDQQRELTFQEMTSPSADHSWSATGGTLTVDSIVGFKITFHVNNATMVANNGTGATGSFTFNGTFVSYY